MNQDSLTDCADARLALSARHDGEAHAGAGLDAHLAHCADCSEFERTLARLAPAWDELDTGPAPAELWSRIEARLEPGPDARLRPRRFLLRAAAGLVGFLGADLAARALETPAPRTHLLTRWLAPPRAEPHRLLAASPEYRLLLSRLPNTEDER